MAANAANNYESELDRVIDYKAEYEAVLQKIKYEKPDQLKALCPFHDDHNPSFSANVKKGEGGIFQCWSCGAKGNYIDFYARYYRKSTKEAYKDLCEKYGISRPQAAKKKKASDDYKDLKPLSLEEYSILKRLPADWLKENCFLETKKDKGSKEFLQIPYFDKDFNEVRGRKRYGNKKPYWDPDKNGQPIHYYGEWFLEDFRQLGWIILVEGESDAQTLWFLGIPAIGVPGSTNFEACHPELLDGLDIYIHQEPDSAGAKFVSKVCESLNRHSHTGRAFIVQCSNMGVKDPSDLFIKYGREKAAEMITAAKEGTKEVDFHKEVIAKAIDDAPVDLRIPDGWKMQKDGLYYVNGKSYEWVKLSTTPVLIEEFMRNIETGEVKAKIVFRYKDHWEPYVCQKSTILQAKSITELININCDVSSETARKMVAYIQALQQENIDLIPMTESTSAFGWKSGHRFVCTCDDEIRVDMPDSERSIAGGYCARGSEEAWLAAMAPHREGSIFRFILAAGFAAPLLRITGQRVFVIYNWGDSGGGKTAALKSALSVWGDPARLTVSFNATQVALERTAAFCCDLPMGVDERQLAGDKQDAVEKIVYMMSSGIGRGRGAKSGGIQQTLAWRNITLMTGEEPLVRDNTQTGVRNRALELFGKPFDDEDAASRIYDEVSENYGLFGPKFVQRIIEIGDKPVRAAFDLMLSYIRTFIDARQNSHAQSVAVVALADAMISSWYFKEDDFDVDYDPEKEEILKAIGVTQYCWEGAEALAADILRIQAENSVSDVNAQAAQFVEDWVHSNKNFFKADVKGTRYGYYNFSEKKAYIYPTILKNALADEGFSPSKTFKYLADKGLIRQEIERTNKGPKKRFEVLKRINGERSRFIEYSVDMNLFEGVDGSDGYAGAADESYNPDADAPLPEPPY